MTSENPTDKEHPSIHTDRESNEQPSNSKQEVSSAEAEPPTTTRAPQHCEATCNTKRDWIDKATLVLEGFGLAVLVTYTIFTGLMYCANKKSADAAKSAADTAADSLKLIKAAERAAFAWQVETYIQQQRVNVKFTNTGKVQAKMLNGEVRFRRISSRGVVLQEDRRPVERSTVVEGADFTIKVPVTQRLTVSNNAFDWTKFKGQDIKVSATIHFDNGFGEIATQDFCKGFVIRGDQPGAFGVGWEDCENAEATRKYQQ